MGFLKTILSALRPIETWQEARLPARKATDLQRPASPVITVCLGAIPSYRRGLLFFSQETPPQVSPGLWVRIKVSEDGNVDIDAEAEPSTIYERLPVSGIVPPDATTVPKMDYFPSYLKMSPAQRAVYLEWLRDVTMPVEIGYVFVFYYGLERHLVYGDFDAAVNEILLLRKHHDNSSFQGYSATALVHACLLRKRVDALQHLYFDLNFDYFGNSALLILHQQNLDLLPDMLLRLAMRLRGVNKRYLKEKCPLYAQALLEELRERFGKESYPFAERYQLDNVTGVPYPIFANTSFASEVRAPPLPNLLEHKPFEREFEAFFQRVHETTKLLRKSGKRLKPPVKALPTETSTSP